MAFEEYIKKAISTGIWYDKLPDRVRAALSLADYKSRVRGYCILKGLPWVSSMAREVCTEQEYYEELIAAYKAWARLYPYHLAGYVARVMRITPFRYYCDVLFMMLKDEKSYDQVPNFTAADALRVTGVGRNQYISIMNACKAKKFMWRVNKGIARDLLPATPLDIQMDSWWVVHVVNVGDAEFRELSAAQANLLRQACEPQEQQQQQQQDHMVVAGTMDHGSSIGPTVSSFDVDLLQQLYKKGLIYLEVPVASSDRLSVPPLEGFVSNKTSEVGDESVDPFEPLLYNLFIANSSRLDQARLADILGVDLQQLLLATSIAIRLGFATKLAAGSLTALDDLGPLTRGLPTGAQGSSQAIIICDSDTESATPTAAGETAARNSTTTASDSNSWEAAAGGGAVGDGVAGAVAVVVDAEATSYLMMGALSPGLKRHSVTLFEGGRVGGAAVINALIAELSASAAAGADFEGDMVQLMHHIQSLAILLSVVRSAAAAQGQQLELLRKESLEGLDPTRAAKVLSHAYTAILQVAPMPGPPLPINPLSVASPTLFGPTAAVDSCWMHLALYSAARCGPVSVVMPAGRRVWSLPGQLEGVTHALLWGWTGPPLLVEGASLLSSLNDMLCRTAVLIQPLVRSHQASATSAGLLSFVDVPLPWCPVPPLEAPQQQQQLSQSSCTSSWDPSQGPLLSAQEAAGVPADQPAAAAATQMLTSVVAAEGTPQQQQQQQAAVSGLSSASVLAVDRQSGKLREFVVPDYLTAALDQLQMGTAVGWLRLVRLPRSSWPGVRSSSSWLPFTLSLGVPLFCPLLCEQICNNMADRRCLTPAGQADWRAAQHHLQQQLWQLITQYGTPSGSSNSSEHALSKQAPGSITSNDLVGQLHELADVGVGLGGVELPARWLLFDGAKLCAVDHEDCMQGVSLW